MILKTLTAAAIAAGTMIVAAAPAQAVITTFAQYQAIGSGSNIYWKNAAANGTSSTSGSVYTISNANSKVAGTTAVKFSFLQPSLAALVGNVTANFTFLATETGNKALLAGGFLIQEGIAGSFSFLSTSVITVGATTYGIGSNLLSGTFSGGAIVGQRLGTSGSLSASSEAPVYTIAYTSAFLSFEPTASLDFALSLTSIASPIQAAPTAGVPTVALRTFKALSTGSFSSDPAPVVTAVPEPAVWGMMILGFGMVGLRSRRRVRNNIVAA